jgi:hypothetical protein
MKNLLFIFIFNSFIFASDLTLQDQAFLSSLTGILIGFTILFFSVFLTIKIGAKK